MNIYSVGGKKDKTNGIKSNEYYVTFVDLSRRPSIECGHLLRTALITGESATQAWEKFSKDKIYSLKNIKRV